MAGSGDGASAIDTFATSRPLPSIPGFVLRHLRMPDDIPAMNDIANTVRRSQGDDFYTTVEQMQQFYDDPPGSDPARDVAIAEIDGQIVGYGRAGWHELPGGPRVYEMLPFLDPTVAGEGVFLAMVDALETRIRTIAADHPAGEKLFETFGGDGAPEHEALLRGLGYEPVRHGYAMLRPSVDDLPDAPLPEGLEIRDVRPEHLPAIWAADQEAFSDAWGFAPAAEGEYERFATDPVMSDTSLWRIAWDDDEVAGQVRSYINDEENEELGRKRGYTEHISVRRPWRRRGLARALIAASFPLLRARGMTEVGIGVDTENVHGALSVYEKCGFRPISRSTTYRRPLA